MAYIAQVPLRDCSVRFRNDCLRFLVQLCLQIKSRFDLRKECLIAKLRVLDPATAHNLQLSPPFISDIASAFPNIIPDDQLDTLDDQWRSFRLDNGIPARKMCQFRTVGTFCVKSKTVPIPRSMSCCRN